MAFNVKDEHGQFVAADGTFITLLLAISLRYLIVLCATARACRTVGIRISHLSCFCSILQVLSAISTGYMKKSSNRVGTIWRTVWIKLGAGYSGDFWDVVQDLR